MNGEGKKSQAEKVPLLHPSGWVKAEISMKERCFWRITVPNERIDFWEVSLGYLKNFVSANAVEGIFNILNYMQKSCFDTFTYCYTWNGNIKAKLKTFEKWVTVTSPDCLFKHRIDVD